MICSVHRVEHKDCFTDKCNCDEGDYQQFAFCCKLLYAEIHKNPDSCLACLKVIGTDISGYTSCRSASQFVLSKCFMSKVIFLNGTPKTREDHEMWGSRLQLSIKVYGSRVLHQNSPGQRLGCAVVRYGSWAKYWFSWWSHLPLLFLVLLSVVHFLSFRRLFSRYRKKLTVMFYSNALATGLPIKYYYFIYCITVNIFIIYYCNVLHSIK